MFDVFFTKKALADIDQSAEYYEKAQKSLSKRFLNEIQAKIRKASENQFLGRSGRVFGTNELILDSFPFIIVFRKRVNRLEIIRVLHQRQQYPK